MQHSNGKPVRVRPGHLVLICEICDAPVTNGQGFLTVRGRKWVFFHENCAAREHVVCGHLPTASGNRPCRINVSLIATAEQLLSALAGLALEIKTTDWLALVQKVSWDTEHYFDPDGLNGGKRSAKALVVANQIAYEKAGLGQQLNERERVRQ